jgi:hypothetical protein
MKKFIVDFDMDGQLFGDYIEAESWEDAEKRLRCVKETGRISGELMGTIPAWWVFCGGFSIWRRIRKFILPFGNIES